MRKIQMYVILPIAVISIICIWFVPQEFPFWSNLSKTIPLVLTVIIISYNNIAYFYKSIRRLVMFIKGDTVSWSSSFKCNINSPIEEIHSNIENFIHKEKFKVIKKSETKYNLGLLENGIYKHIEIFITQISDGYRFKIQYTSSVSYKDSRTQFQEFESLIDRLLQNFRYTNCSYSIKIIFSKFNPFYILTIKHIDKPKKLNFILTFEDDGLAVKIYPNSLEASSSERNKILKIFKDYITVSSIGKHIDTI
ncbi:hypothetical protein MX101_04805 [Streptococcus uberis]|nr:hypothetical protein [Streptococcus uberis]MCK1255388.1 hypothetical protein [Streptococcus uberis]